MSRKVCVPDKLASGNGKFLNAANFDDDEVSTVSNTVSPAARVLFYKKSDLPFIYRVSLSGLSYARNKNKMGSSCLKRGQWWLWWVSVERRQAGPGQYGANLIKQRTSNHAR